MPTPAALSLEKREAILDGAGEVFSAHGYEGASMSEITRAAGTSKGTIYHHFGDKAGLFGAFVERECERSIASFFAAIPEDMGTVQTLTGIGMRMIELLLSPICLTIDRVVTSEASTFPELARVFYAAGPERAITLLGSWLDERVRRGELAIQDTEFAAEQFFTLCQTRVFLRRRLHIPDDEPKGVPKHVVQAAVATFMRAYDVREDSIPAESSGKAAPRPHA